MLLADGLEWEDWELKEMVRERLQEQREAAALDYRARLRAVETLCSAEVGRLEDALQALVPLNVAASSWGPVRPLDHRSAGLTYSYKLSLYFMSGLYLFTRSDLSREETTRIFSVDITYDDNINVDKFRNVFNIPLTDSRLL